MIGTFSPHLGGHATRLGKPILQQNPPPNPRHHLDEIAGLEKIYVAKVLVVDDAAFMRLRACKVLQDNGHEVVQAENGADAIRQYAEHRPDAVLLDITMPEMDGLEALKEIRRIDPAARVAMVTAMGQQAIVMEALRAGAKDFVLKPFQPDRVLGALQKLLAS
jgi:two-component system chemotaxis response regulator CheY